MTFDVCFTYKAEAFCTVEAESEADIISAIENGNFTVYDETCDDDTRENYCIIEEDGLRRIG